MGSGLIDAFIPNILSVPFCPCHLVHTILSNAILSVYHFVDTILSVPFCPLYHFARSPLCIMLYTHWTPLQVACFITSLMRSHFILRLQPLLEQARSGYKQTKKYTG